MGQDIVYLRVGRRDPSNLRERSGLKRESQFFAAEPEPHLAHGTLLGKTLEQSSNGTGHGFIGVEENLPIPFPVDKANGKATPQLPACGLVADASVQACTDDVEFGLGHSAFESQDKPVVVQIRVIQAIFVRDQRIGDPTEVEKLVPVGTVARQP